MAIKIQMKRFSDHKKVVRFNAEKDDAAITSVYVSKDALKEMDNPNGDKPITVTIS
jgi:hypothetical protein